MTNRTITVAAAQLGPIQRAEPRSVAVERMIRLLERAHHRGVELVVFAELARETDATGQSRERRFNTAILVSPDGEILLKYRKVHLPGHAELDPRRTTQHLEKRYFEVGNLGFPVIRAPM